MRAAGGRVAALVTFAMFYIAGVAGADDTPLGAPVDDAVLSQVRGGFDGNLHAALQLERLAYVNGEQVAKLAVDIPDIANMTVEQATALSQAAGTLIVQAGAQNPINVMDLGPASTVIQNTLSDQHLVTLTTISVEVNSLSAFRELAFQDGVRDGLGSIVGVR